MVFSQILVLVSTGTKLSDLISELGKDLLDFRPGGARMEGFTGVLLEQFTVTDGLIWKGLELFSNGGRVLFSMYSSSTGSDSRVQLKFCLRWRE